MKPVATSLPTTIEEFQLALEAAFAGGKALGSALASAETPPRKPLTDEEIWDEVKAADLDWQNGWTLDEDAPNRYITFARAIEAAHGITGETK